jgi:hypothetical protein
MLLALILLFYLGIASALCAGAIALWEWFTVERPERKYFSKTRRAECRYYSKVTTRGLY